MRWLLCLLLLASSILAAQDQPPDTLPAGAKGSILPLEFPVAELQFPSVALQFPKIDLEASAGELAFKESKLDLHLALSTDILFEFDRSDLRPQAVAALEQAATLIRERTRGAIAVAGHSDSKGRPGYNLELSKRRAAAVRDWLTTKGGLANRKYTVIGKGASEPVASEQLANGRDNAAGRAKNRRVELVIRR